MQHMSFCRFLYIMLSISPGLIFHSTAFAINSSFFLQDIFQNQRELFSGFLDNVLRQKSSSDFYAQADKIFANERPTTDEEYYKLLLQHRNELIPQFSTYYTLKLIGFQKELLAKQAMQLLGNEKRYTHCLEIGTPGTYLSALSSVNSTVKEISVINEMQQITDVLQAFALRPLNGFLAYDHFYPLNNYEPISDNIADNSLDLIICFIGLHHIPLEKIESFTASIARVLKPGGTFLLRDHDCYDSKIESIIYGAHSIYNIVIPGESEESEKNEIRNFQPLNYWITLLESFGLEVSDDRILQEGDSSLNTMIKCTKTARTAQEHIALACTLAAQNPDYERGLVQSYLNAPEWYNVDASQEYGNFINHTPFYAFPYFSNIANYWKIYACSLIAAAKKRGITAALTSPHNLMDMFVGISMSIEYAAKGLMSLPISYMYAGDEPLSLEAVVHEHGYAVEELDERIEVIATYGDATVKRVRIPRYKDFLEIVRKLATHDVDIVEVVGNKEIACKIRYASNQIVPANPVEGCTLEYTWVSPTQTEYTYAVLTVAFSRLKETIAYCDANAINILYFHDY